MLLSRPDFLFTYLFFCHNWNATCKASLNAPSSPVLSASPLFSSSRAPDPAAPSRCCRLSEEQNEYKKKKNWRPAIYASGFLTFSSGPNNLFSLSKWLYRARQRSQLFSRTSPAINCSSSYKRLSFFFFFFWDCYAKWCCVLSLCGLFRAGEQYSAWLRCR